MMSAKLDQAAKAINDYVQALNRLRELEVLKNNQSFTGQIGEWLVETLYDGKRADNSIQKGWDVDVNGLKIQVKSHAKADQNNSRFSMVDITDGKGFDVLMIVVFDKNYKLLEVYRATYEQAKPAIRQKNQKSPRYEVNWSELEEYRISIESLPKQKIVAWFR